MLLIAVNYKEEIDYNYFSKYDFVEIKIFNEKKWGIFAFKLQKYILENPWKYDMILHFWLCWWRDADQIWKIYKINRSFLYNDKIIDNQRNRFGRLKFKNIENINIVTKFVLWSHFDFLYDFWIIYDLETFWISQLSTLISQPLISIKWVSDINDSFIYNMSESEEIDFLLNPENKRQRKQIIIDKLSKSITNVNLNFQEFFERDFKDFYFSYVNDNLFRKKFLTESQ